MSLAIEADKIFKTFKSDWRGRKKKEALRGVSLKVKKGEIFGILGPNGAGKTTLLSILSTLLLPDHGQVKIFGFDGIHNGHKIRELVNISSGNANFLWSMTVRENLNFYGMLYGLIKKDRLKKIDSLIELFELQEYRDVPFDQLSTGLKQRLSLAKSLLNDPSLLFLDEPTVGLDPDVSARIREMILSIHKERRITVLLTTHNMKEAEHLCERIAFLKAGKIIAIGSPQELKRMVRIGDVIKIEYNGLILEDQLLHAEGVINFSISDNICEMIVDDGEKRLGSIISMISKNGTFIKNVNIGQTDLEDVFIEFAKGSDSDMGLCD
jgi:ABC-2 type transport system ATP-binding protein